MKKLALITLMLFSLYGCSTTHRPETADVPVWTPPKISMPPRPKLVSDGKGTDGEIARKATIDLYNMEEYSFKLENLLEPLQGASGVVPTSAVSK